MRVLHFISAPAAGGAEVYVKDLSKAFKELGHEVFVGFLEHGADVGRSTDFENKYLAELTQAGIKYFFVGHKARYRPWVGLWRVRRFIKKNRVDVYHSHLFYGLIFGAFSSVKNIYTHHNINPKAPLYLFHVFNLFVDRYIGISNNCSKSLGSYTGKDVLTIFNGVDKNRLTNQQKIRSPSFMVKCLCVGSICPQKNYFLLVDAVSLLPDVLKFRMNIAVVGEGEESYTLSLKEYVCSKGLAAVFTFMGNRSDVPELMFQSDLFVMSSDFEGLPIALIEASMSGLACIVTNVGGCSEVISICKNGVLVNSNDAHAFSVELGKIIGSPSTIREYSSNALKYSDVFDIELSAASHVTEYEKCIM